ncbi:MAG: hypothetical protein QM790_11450 [Nibricoccus sp.]
MKTLSSLVGIFTFLIAPGVYAETKPIGSDKPIVLPEAAITGRMKLRPEEKWITATVENFEIFSGSSERETRAFITEFYRFHQAFVYLFPKAKIKPTEKLKIVLCGTTEKFSALAPSSFSNLSTTVSDGRSSYLLIDMDVRSKYHVSSSDSSSNIQTGASGMSGFEPGPLDMLDGTVLARREYIHFIFDRTKPRPPLWLEEGAAMYFSTLDVGRSKITWGKIGPDIVRWMNPRGIMDLDKFFSIPARDSAAYGFSFSRQALLLMHYFLFSHGMRYRSSFIEFAERASTEPVTEAMFKQYLQMSYNEAEITLLWYAKDGGFFKHPYAPVTTKFPAAPSYTFRKLSDAECGRLKGEVLRLSNRFDDANAELLSPIIRKHSDPQLVASLGILEHSMGNFTAAKKHLEEATAAKAGDYLAYIALARIYLHEALAAAADNGSLSVDQMAHVLKPLFAARSLEQPHPAIYSLIADVWNYSRVPPTQENLAVLDEGVLKFPTNTELIYKDAALKARYKFYDDAHALVALGLRHARDEATKIRFNQLKAQLPEVANAIR